MIYTDMTRLAMKIAFEAHAKQKDRAGLPYITHPLHVAESMTTEDSCVVALLHDVIEDTDLTIEDLRGYGFSEDQLTAISLLTREKGEDYFEYVSHIRGNELATVVKLSDLKHNSDITRIPKPTEKDLKRLEKYEKAKCMLLEKE